MEGFISKVLIKNFKSFEGEFWLDLQPHTNIIVGDNEAGKSTILEAIHLVLSGLFQGRSIAYELSQDIFNQSVLSSYLTSTLSTEPQQPPHILIELFFDGITDEGVKALLEGDGNSTRKKACGIGLKIDLSDAHRELYDELITEGSLTTLPIEYYECKWFTFAREESLRPSLLPIKSAFIDSSTSRYQNGSDVYISRIVKDHLSKDEHIKVTQAHRKLKEHFNKDPSINAINTSIEGSIDISDKRVRLSVDLSSKNAWENSLITLVNEIPFHLIGKGEQTTIKTRLALSHKKTNEANILLLEEPENHLSHTNLNRFIKYLSQANYKKQVIITTHSSFVANKLGLANLILLAGHKEYTTMKELKEDTQDYFSKLSGYDTLRLILCEKAILVEGPSDELIVQRAYMDNHNQRLPIEDGIEVISVGTSFPRFLEVGKKLGIKITVVTDNDGDIPALERKYNDYNNEDNFHILYDSEVDSGDLEKFNYNTLEPKILKANNLNTLNSIFGTSYTTDDELLTHMKKNKTECALAIFNSSQKILYPKYIMDAVTDETNA